MPENDDFDFEKTLEKELESSQKDIESTVKAVDETESTVKSTVKILNLVKEKPDITRQGMSEILGLSIEGVDKNIKKLKQHGQLVRVGGDKGGHWEIVK